MHFSTMTCYFLNILCNDFASYIHKTHQEYSLHIFVTQTHCAYHLSSGNAKKKEIFEIFHFFFLEKSPKIAENPSISQGRHTHTRKFFHFFFIFSKLAQSKQKFHQLVLSLGQKTYLRHYHLVVTTC